MSALLLAAIVALTYASRAVALALLPVPRAGLQAALARMPAPIFASLATAMLITDDRALMGGPTLWAAVGALLASPLRSLALCLVGGAVGYAIAALLP
jgi:hypothetical protein